MSTRELIATVTGILAVAAVLLGLIGALYFNAQDNHDKDRQFVADCTVNGGSIINGQCINLRDLAPAWSPG
jgi:hypothetical protein